MATATLTRTAHLTPAEKRNSELHSKAHKAGMEALEKVTSHGGCGFAWININPGNSSFARYLTKNKIARKAYEGGINVWVREGGQSIEAKMAYAAAYARVVNQAGITAYPQSRMD